MIGLVLLPDGLGKVPAVSTAAHLDLVHELADVADALGRPVPTLADSHVQRWGGGLPQYTVGHRARIARVDADVATVPGLAVTGASYGGLGIAAVVAHAQAAARTILTHLARPKENA